MFSKRILPYYIGGEVESEGGGIFFCGNMGVQKMLLRRRTIYLK